MELCLLGAASFDGVYRLMEESFPPDEIRSHEGQKALLEDARYHIYAALRPDGSIQGIMAVWKFAEFAFLEHFAVSPADRNSGIGSAMLQALKERVQTDICLEAELPETELACRRIGFYERNGFSVQDYPYVQPALGADRKPIPLILMTTGGKKDRAQLDKIKAILYRNVYHTNQA
jgi:ribosomal protein S18 acetylase RimI-like enzyme